MGQHLRKQEINKSYLKIFKIFFIKYKSKTSKKIKSWMKKIPSTCIGKCV